METKELAKQLGISHQMANRCKAKGMPKNSLKDALAWRKINVHPFQSKTGRIGGGNTGVKNQPIKKDIPDINDMIHKVKSAQFDLDGIDADILFKNARALKEKALALTGGVRA